MSDDNFRKISHRKFIFAHPVYLEAVRVHLVSGSYFRSCKKDGGHAIRSTVGENLAIAENRILHTHFTALCVTDAELLTMEFSHSGLVLTRRIPLQVYWMVVDLFCSLTLT